MEKIKEMSIDLETYSDVDIKKSGVYKYAESENFEILLFAVSINGDDVIVYDLACGDVLPDEILDAIVSDDVIKWAFNASFERICLSYWMKRNYPDRFCSYSIPEDTVGNYLNPASWRCTMIWSAYMGLPLDSLCGIIGRISSLCQSRNKIIYMGKHLTIRNLNKFSFIRNRICRKYSYLNNRIICNFRCLQFTA